MTKERDTGQNQPNVPDELALEKESTLTRRDLFKVGAVAGVAAASNSGPGKALARVIVSEQEARIGNTSSQAPFAANIIPPSPEAAALAAYADIPVNLYTGIPEITIPLYELKERDLKVPIFLNYHASAHKVEDQASRVGLGWSISAGGMVTRSIRGLPDEYAPGGFLHQAAQMNGQVAAYAAGSDEERFGWYDAMARECRSAEPDIYYFNFAGYSGKFQFDWNSSICIASDAALRITPIGLNISNDTFIQGWEIVTPDGVRWTFDVKESMATRFRGSAFLGNCRAILESKKPPQAWHLTEIASPFTDSRVKFAYRDYFQTLERWSLETQVHNVNLSPATPAREKLISEVRGKYLSEISTSSGDTAIEFIQGPNRTDVTGSGLHTLGVVRVKNRHASFVKGWKFEYDYSVGRLTLKSLQEYSNNDIKPPFIFKYYGGQLPNALSLNQDHWGFPNNNSTSTLIPRAVVSLPSGPQILPGADRSSAPAKLTAGMLRQITYPTGGTDKFDFEPHDYSFEQDRPLKVPITVGKRIDGSAPMSDTLPGQEHVERTPFSFSEELELTLIATFTYGMVAGGGVLAPPSVEIEKSNGERVFKLAPGGVAEPDGEPTQQVLAVVFNPRENGGGIGTAERLPPGSYVFVVRCKMPSTTLYGSNRVHASLRWQAPTGEFTTLKVQGARVRIARISRTYGFGNPDSVRTFHYTTQVEGKEVSSGSLLESYYVYAKWMTYFENTVQGGETKQKFVRFAQNRSALGTTHGSHVGYSKVTVMDGTNEENGRSVYTFTSAIDFPDAVDLEIPFAPPMSLDYKRGLLVEQLDFRSIKRPGSIGSSILTTIRSSRGSPHRSPMRFSQQLMLTRFWAVLLVRKPAPRFECSRPASSSPPLRTTMPITARYRACRTIIWEGGIGKRRNTTSPAAFWALCTHISSRARLCASRSNASTITPSA